MVKRTRILALVCALGTLASTVSQAAPTKATTTNKAASVASRAFLDEIAGYRRATWHWERVIGLPHTSTATSADPSPDPAYRRWVRNLWRQRATRIARKGQHPPHRAQWLCLHRYEGAWNANTGNGYYGGLQMNLAFQRVFGAYLLRKKGTADKWTPAEQMWVAERAHASGAGFLPWPNTARICGLI